MTRRELLRTGPLALLIAPVVVMREAAKPEPTEIHHGHRVDRYSPMLAAEQWNEVLDRLDALEGR